MEEKYKFIVPKNKEKERIDLFLTREIKNTSRSKVKVLIESGNVLVNSKKTKKSHLVNPGEIIEVVIPVSKPEKIVPENIPLDVIYEDNEIVLINKKPGMVVHPACGNFSGTLVNALLYRYKNLSELGGVLKPGIVHRLDKDTSGVIIVARNDRSHRILAQQFFERKIEKIYWAVIWGTLNQEEGTIEENLRRSKKDRKKFVVSFNGKRGVTHFKLLEEFYLLSLVEVKPRTGRTHQIRSHFAHIGNPIFGDPVYGGRNRKLSHLTAGERVYISRLLSIMNRQALHAKSIGFFHPSTGEFMTIEASLPDDFKVLLELLEREKKIK